MIKPLQLTLIALVIVLQYQLWFGENNRFETRRMERELFAEQADLEIQLARNNRLRAEVKDLQHGLDVHEELARSELGYIREDEIFFRVVE
ncbi:MAG: cell division protein FtsB [Gammaproteobacteria bacterium]|nr:MAG: cell division protein FtsB [Gammaproteobacteria bacterium]RLA13067.1 MAG: cell division protein FtsB [Gammaproteobacteria bacterium]